MGSITFITRTKALRAQRRTSLVLREANVPHSTVADGGNKKGRPQATPGFKGRVYSVDSISKPQASSNGSGIYFEFLFFRAHSRNRVERMY
jgi:hypothetical protein